MTPLPTGAWNLWRDEVLRGVRDRNDPDLLFRAAWCDANGLDALDDGFPMLAAAWFTESARYVALMGEQERAA